MSADTPGRILLVDHSRGALLFEPAMATDHGLLE